MTKTINFKPVSKDRLFYDQYRYCISFELKEVTCLRNLDHKYIDAIVARRRLWREHAYQRWKSIGGGQIPIIGSANLLKPNLHPITELQIAHLHTLADMLITSGVKFKLVTGSNNGWLYTNSVELINKVDALEPLKHKMYSEAIIARPKDTIVLKNAKYERRSYFKSTKLTQEEKTTLTNFLSNHIENIGRSPALVSWSESSYHRLQDYFFIDYTEESWILLIALIKPGLIRKTVTILPAK